MVVALLMLFSVGAETAHAQATEIPPAANWQFGAEALTDFPIHVGAKLWLELPYRLRINTTFGALPGGYVDAINGFLVAVGAYSQQTADMIAAALKSSFVWRVHGGWRPFKRRGAYFEAGYGLVTLGGGLSAAQTDRRSDGQNPSCGHPGDQRLLGHVDAAYDRRSNSDGNGCCGAA